MCWSERPAAGAQRMLQGGRSREAHGRDGFVAPPPTSAQSDPTRLHRPCGRAACSQLGLSMAGTADLGSGCHSSLVLCSSILFPVETGSSAAFSAIQFPSSGEAG